MELGKSYDHPNFSEVTPKEMVNLGGSKPLKKQGMPNHVHNSWSIQQLLATMSDESIWLYQICILKFYANTLW